MARFGAEERIAGSEAGGGRSMVVLGEVERAQGRDWFGGKA